MFVCSRLSAQRFIAKLIIPTNSIFDGVEREIMGSIREPIEFGCKQDQLDSFPGLSHRFRCFLRAYLPRMDYIIFDSSTFVVAFYIRASVRQC